MVAGDCESPIVRVASMKFLIVCRGSTSQGLGHLLRARTFAKTVCRSHEVEILAILEAGLEGILSDMPCQVLLVRGDDELIEAVCGSNPDVCVLDTTTLMRDVLLHIKGVAGLTASLSPIFEHAADIDVLFTRSKRVPTLDGVKVFGGLQYAVFGEHGRRITEETFEQNLTASVKPIAVCMGGTDAANKTHRVLQVLSGIQHDLTIWVLLGEGYAHSYDALVAASRTNSRHEVILAKTNRSMWKLMDRCVLAILAGGLTTVEAVYAGLPSINLFEDQGCIDATAQEMFELGVCLNGGLFSEDALATMVRALQFLLINPDELRQMRALTKGLVDRRGSERVLSRLEQEYDQRFRGQQRSSRQRQVSLHAKR